MYPAPRPSILERYAVDHLRPGDLAGLRLVLDGGSVVDWHRLHFTSRDEVDHFLRLCQFDPDDPVDQRRMRAILREAVDYLFTTFRYRVPAILAEPNEIHDILQTASGTQEHRRLRRIACVLLKVMHTVMHVDARELLSRARISEVEIGHEVDTRVRAAVTLLRDTHGLPICGFEGNSKARTSVITKLLSKRENVAATVYDRHRYRVVVPDPGDIIPVVLALQEQLFPFSLVVPGQTQNTLVPFDELVQRSSHVRALRDAMDPSAVGTEPSGRQDANSFSGSSYKILNFIVYLPIRLDLRAVGLGADEAEALGRIVFSHVEFQVVDARTQDRNEAGENSHGRYKHRQRLQVLRRLTHGLIPLPRRSWRADEVEGADPVDPSAAAAETIPGPPVSSVGPSESDVASRSNEDLPPTAVRTGRRMS